MNDREWEDFLVGNPASPYPRVQEMRRIERERAALLERPLNSQTGFNQRSSGISQRELKEIEAAIAARPLVAQGRIKTYTGRKFLFWRHGIGTATHTDGLRYEGRWSFGKWRGQGTLTRPGKWFYAGRFANGVMWGEGVLTFKSGEKIEGRFANGLPKGKVKLELSDGSRFEGKWFGAADAKGKFFGADGSANPAMMENGVITIKPGIFRRRKTVAVFDLRKALT
ncbi:MAG: hypothetical protein KIS67_09090 [Verrucomicrobiae bacterium]|nr:hypothetical protein [Verrucomicrobiae bacterium]